MSINDASEISSGKDKEQEDTPKSFLSHHSVTQTPVQRPIGLVVIVSASFIALAVAIIRIKFFAG